MLGKEAGHALRRGAQTALVVALTFLATSELARSQVIIDGEGFEPPAYSLGQLEGQFAQLPADGTQQRWVASIGTTSTANVQNSIALGQQAVRVDRAPNELPGGGRFGVPVIGWPSKRYVCIVWDMWVEEATGPTGTFGPFFGVEAYDDDGVGNSNGLMGSLGVDATTGDVLYQAAGTGFLTESGSTVNFGEWNRFHIDLDYQTHEYTLILNGVSLLTEPFVDGAGLDQFTDAPIATFAAAGDSASQALGGTAYFDNYHVFQLDFKIPEPSTMLLVLGAATMLPCYRRRR